MVRPSQLSLRGLEVFLLAARSGSIKAVAEETGLAPSTVSHHLRSLEDALGLALIDHARRPLALTQQGALLLPYVEGALGLLDRAQLAVVSGDLAETRALRLALIEDFDSEIAPEMARLLAAGMPRCDFAHLTRPSHEIIDLIRKRELDVGIASRPEFDVEDLVMRPLLRDPFVLAVPAGAGHAAESYLGGAVALPLLRYSPRHFIGARIEAQLRRMRVSVPHRFAFESNQSLLGLVAEGQGWAITTPTNYARAQRFQPGIRLLPFPGRGFARYVCVFTAPGYNAQVRDFIAAALRRLIQSRIIDPMVARMEWLSAGFHLEHAPPEIDA
ncbi:MAG: LysR family transcriptional regulator [Pseudomonadota bacterium]